MPVIVEEVSVEAIPDGAQHPAATADADNKPSHDRTPAHELPRQLRWLHERAERVRAH